MGGVNLLYHNSCMCGTERRYNQLVPLVTARLLSGREMNHWLIDTEYISSLIQYSIRNFQEPRTERQIKV